jgi:hypothetical protein
MILGMSNTFQQIVTSLKISDLKYMLSKYGDSRVGTNSPFNIQHKQHGKRKAWAAWLVLVLTSMPVHFLANSLIGPSYAQELPTNIEYQPYDKGYASGSAPGMQTVASDMSFPCWSAFRMSSIPKYLPLLN